MAPSECTSECVEFPAGRYVSIVTPRLGRFAAATATGGLIEGAYKFETHGVTLKRFVYLVPEKQFAKMKTASGDVIKRMEIPYAFDAEPEEAYIDEGSDDADDAEDADPESITYSAGAFTRPLRGRDRRRRSIAVVTFDTDSREPTWTYPEDEPAPLPQCLSDARDVLHEIEAYDPKLLKLYIQKLLAKADAE